MTSDASFPPCKRVNVETGCNENTVMREGPSTSGK